MQAVESVTLKARLGVIWHVWTFKAAPYGMHFDLRILNVKCHRLSWLGPYFHCKKTDVSDRGTNSLISNASKGKNNINMCLYCCIMSQWHSYVFLQENVSSYLLDLPHISIQNEQLHLRYIFLMWWNCDFVGHLHVWREYKDR